MFLDEAPTLSTNVIQFYMVWAEMPAVDERERAAKRCIQRYAMGLIAVVY